MDNISLFKSKTEKVLNLLKEDLKTIRTGRATPSLVEDLIVETYNGSAKLRLLELSTITSDGAQNLIIVPFDPSTLKDIEKAILKSPLGLTPSNQGGRIVIRIPSLSQEQREKYVRLVSEKVEERKNQIRNIRDEIRKMIKKAFEEKKMTEDQKLREEKEIDNLTAKINEEIQAIKIKKEEEIKTI